MGQEGNVEFIDELYQTMKDLESAVSDSWKYVQIIRDNADKGIRDLEPVYNLHMKMRRALSLESYIIKLTIPYVEGTEQRN